LKLNILWPKNSGLQNFTKIFSQLAIDSLFPVFWNPNQMILAAQGGLVWYLLLINDIERPNLITDTAWLMDNYPDTQGQC